MKLFYKWEDVWDVKERLFIMVDNNFKFDENCNIKPFSKLQRIIGDFVDLSSPDVMIYIAFKEQNLNSWDKNYKIVPTTYVFKKNTLYDYNNNSRSGGGNSARFLDEIGNVIDDYHDIWYDPFVFVYERDLKQFERFLKIKELNDIT
jgi:hypothetical protein